MISWLIFGGSVALFGGTMIYYHIHSLKDSLKILGWCLSAALLGFVLDASTLTTAYQVWSAFLTKGMVDFKGTTLSQIPNVAKATVLVLYSGIVLSEIKEITYNYDRRTKFNKFIFTKSNV
jgi:hypothetical protein